MKAVMLVFVLFITACGSKKTPATLFDKLAGTWLGHDSESDLYEEWTSMNNDSLMYGKSYMMNGGDTIIIERIVLSCKTNDMYYAPVVTGQNNNEPVVFRLLRKSDSSVVFENKTHDFPQRIVYRLFKTDSLIARIEGNKQGEFSFAEYNFRKLK